MGDSTRLDLALKVVIISLIVAVLGTAGYFGWTVYNDRVVAERSSPAGRIIAVLRDQVKAKPNDAALRVRLGQALSAVGRDDEAIEQFNAALKIDPEHTGALIDLGHLAVRNKRMTEADGYFREVVKITDGGEFEAASDRREVALYQLGVISVSQRRYEDAIGYDDPAFRRAAQQKDAISRGEKPASDDSKVTPPSTTTDPKPGDGDTSGPVGALEKYVPATLEGYTAQRASTDALVMSRNYVPGSGSQAVLLVIQAEQFRTAAEAKSALGDAMRFATSKSASTQDINGHEVKLGDNGRDSSFAGFTDGSILVSMEMAAKRGVDPSRLKSAVVDVVKALP